MQKCPRSPNIECDWRVVVGDVCTRLAETAAELEPDLVVLGPHRRQALKDLFISTTVERTIRAVHRPVLMASGIPAGPYRHVLVAVDLSQCSADAIGEPILMELECRAAVAVVYVFDAPVARLIPRHAMSDAEISAYISERAVEASRELADFLDGLPIQPLRKFVRPNDGSVAAVISELAREISADLIVVGTHSRTGTLKLLLGSVAEQILRDSDRDVLVVPPLRRS